MVVHAHVDSSPVRVGGPRFGLIVSRLVGDSVTRHRVSRRLRHLAAELITELEPADDLLVGLRGNKAAVNASQADRRRDLRTTLKAATEWDHEETTIEL